MAPLVHWPEVMVTYDSYDKTLYSADAFGTFGALDGALFNDEVDFEHEWLDDARRYYGNIVGKYGPQVLNAMKKIRWFRDKIHMSFSRINFGEKILLKLYHYMKLGQN